MIKSTRVAFAFIIVGVVILSGCKHLQPTSNSVPAPLMPTAPSPYSFPRNGAYTPADPMPEDFPVPPLPQPGYSIPLNAPPASPAPASAPTPALEPLPLPPAPGESPSARNQGDKSSGRSFSKMIPPRLLRSPFGRPAVEPEATLKPATDDASVSDLGKPLPLTQLSHKDAAAMAPALAPGQVCASRNVLANPQTASGRVPSLTGDAIHMDDDGPLPEIVPNQQQAPDAQSVVPNWPKTSGSSASGRAVRLRKHSAIKAESSNPPVSKSTLPPINDSPSVPPLLPPGP